MFFLDPRFLLNEHRHELSEQLVHDVHALLTCFHIIKSVTHGKEHRLHPSGVRRVVQFRISLRDVRDSDEGSSRLQGLQSFLEAVEP